MPLGLSKSLETPYYRVMEVPQENYTLKPASLNLALFFSTKVSGFVYSSQRCALLYMQPILYHADTWALNSLPILTHSFSACFVYPLSCRHGRLFSCFSFSHHSNISCEHQGDLISDLFSAGTLGKSSFHGKQFGLFQDRIYFSSSTLHIVGSPMSSGNKMPTRQNT